MPWTPFLEKYKGNKLPEIRLQEKVENDLYYWFPIFMGVATKEEVHFADAAELQYLNAIAEEKKKLQQYIAEGRPIEDG